MVVRPEAVLSAVNKYFFEAGIPVVVFFSKAAPGTGVLDFFWMHLSNLLAVLCAFLIHKQFRAGVVISWRAVLSTVLMSAALAAVLFLAMNYGLFSRLLASDPGSFLFYWLGWLCAILSLRFCQFSMEQIFRNFGWQV